MAAITLRPGTPDDDNRDYLPDSLRHSDVVVNENGNNSIPWPEGLTEHTDVLVGDEPDTWYRYVPSDLDPDRPVPLVISLHGGLMYGWAQAVYTSWTLVAEREGFIVLFPNAHARQFWLVDLPEEARAAATSDAGDGVFLNVPPTDPDENHDHRALLELIERTAAEFPVDRSRIYMQGMSMGNIMTTQFARFFGDVLAGAAGSAGSTSLGLLFDEHGERINRAGPVPVFETRVEHDDVPGHYGDSVRDVYSRNLDYWLGVNGHTGTPTISVRGEHNVARWDGGAAPVVYQDVKNRDHGQTLDDAEIVWSTFFSGLRRAEDGSVEVGEPDTRHVPDAVSVAVADGRSAVWLDQVVEPLDHAPFTWRKLKYHGLNGDSIVRGEYLYVPVALVQRAFGGTLDDHGATARWTTPDGRRVDVARGSDVALVDGSVVAMLAEAVERDGVLHVSLEWIARDVLGLHASQVDGVLYVTDHHSQLSLHMAHLLDDLLAAA